MPDRQHLYNAPRHAPDGVQQADSIWLKQIAAFFKELRIERLSAIKRGDEVTPIDRGLRCHGGKRCNGTHQGVTGPDARLYKKSPAKEAKLAHMGHVLIKNRHGLAVDAMTMQATGTAEREAAKRPKKGRRITAGAGKGYDVQADVKADVRALRAMGVTPHIAGFEAKTGKRRTGAIGGRAPRHAGHAISQLIACLSGYAKHAGTLRNTRHRGLQSVSFDFQLNLVAYKLIRIPKLLAGTGQHAAQNKKRLNRASNIQLPSQKNQANSQKRLASCWKREFFRKLPEKFLL